MMVAAFQSLYASDFVDDREPLLHLTLPKVGVVGITSFSPLFWLQSLFLVMLQSLLNVGIALIIYKVILRRKETAQTYLIGYGILCPLLLYLPLYTIRILGLQNIALVLCLAGTTPSLLILRSVEAMHGTLPAFAEDSQKNFVLYFAATLGFQFNFDTKTKEVMPLTRSELRTKVATFARLFLETSLYLSVLLPYDCALFPRRKVESVLDLCHLGNMCNSLLLAFMFSTSIEAGSKGISLAASLLTGFSTTEMSDRPLTASTSVSEFWGQRWNRIMAGGLRRGIFQPARKVGCPRPVAALMTFFASGLFHEYILLLIASRGAGMPMGGDSNQKTYIPNFGYQTAFFAWNGVVLVAESMLIKHPAIVWIRTHFPKPMLTALVLLSVLPMGHLFIDEYVEAGFFSDQSLGYPKLVWLGASAP